MKKVFAVTKVAALLTVFLFFTLLFTTCGGGAAGGAGGASIPDSEYSTHNAGGWGGGGNSGGSGGSSGSGGNGVNMTGGTPLFVERYEDPVTGTFAGSQLNDLIAAIQNNSSRSNSVFNIPFYVVGDPVVRQARVTKGRTKVEKFEHQYKATCNVTTPSGTNSTVFYYYTDDGINLASVTTAEMTGWQCLEDGSVHNGSHITNITGDVTLVPVYTSGAGPINGGVIRTDLHTGAVPPVSETFDYQTLAGTTVSGSVVYITVPPLTAGTVLYTENGNNVTVSGYNVHFNINSVPFAVTFNPGDTQSKVIENIPLGANISMNAIIDVSDDNGYTVLNTETVSLTAQAGGGATMYTEYPLSCHIGDLFTSGGADITGSSYPSYYTNNGTPTDISSAAPTPSYTNPGNPPQTMYFAGWALNPTDTVPVIAGNIIPADGTYKGALNLYAVYNSCSVSINEPSTHVISEGANDYQLTLNATSNGFSSPVTYTWSVENQNANTAVAVNSSTGLVTIVPGKTGTEIVKVTATDGTYTATNTISISVVALSLPADPIVLSVGDTGTAINGSLLGGYTGSVTYTWSKNPSTGSSVDLSDTTTTSPSNTVTPIAGDKTTITVTPCIDGTQYLGSKTIDVYVLDLQLSGDGLTTAGNGYGLMTTMYNTAGTSVSASLAGTGMPSTTFSWAYGTGSSAYLELDGTTGTPRKITPKADGAGTVTVSTSYGGVTVSKTINVVVLGLSLTEGPIYITEGGNCDITASVPNYGSGVNYDWVFSGSSVTTVGTTPADDNGEEKTLGTLAGGKSTITVTATLSATNTQLPSKSIDVYVVDLQLSCNSFLPGTNNIVMTSSSTDSSVVIASLVDGPNMPPTTFTWTVNSNATDYIELDGTDNNTNDATDTRTVKPKAAGTDKTFTVTADCGTVTVSKTINVNVAGLSVPAGPIVLTKGGSGQPITAEVIGDSNATISWEVPSTPNIVTISPTSGNTRTITPVTGGKTTLTFSTYVNGRQLSKTIDIYVLDLQLSGGINGGLMALGGGYYNLVMPAGSSNVPLTAELANISSSEVTFEWDTISNATVNGTGGSRTITPSSVGSSTFTIQAKITGTTQIVTTTVSLKVVSLTISGSDCFAYNETKTYEVSTQDGITLSNITFSELTDTENIASISQTANTGTVTATKGGTYTIQASATVSGTSITLTDSKTITILRPVIKQSGSELANTGFELGYGSSMYLTVELEGGLTATSWSWQTAPTDIITINTSGAYNQNASITTNSAGYVNITATANYGNGTATATATKQILVKFDSSNLSDYLGSLPTGSQYVNVLPPITGLTTNNWGNIKAALEVNPNVYVDLSATQLPEGITDMSSAFASCTNLVKAPKLPNSVTNLESCFYWCTHLTTPPDLSACTNLVNMYHCFEYCDALTSAPVIPASVQNMAGCFYECVNLEGTVTINAFITDHLNWTQCFYLGPSLTSKIVKIKVPDAATRTALLNSDWLPSELQTKIFIPGESGY